MWIKAVHVTYSPMAQININTTPEFERDLKTLMKRRQLTRKSDAIRYAVHAAVESDRRRRDFQALIGALDTYPDNPRRCFADEDELWSGM